MALAGRVIGGGPPAVCACGRRYKCSRVTGGKARPKQRQCPWCVAQEKAAKRRKKQKD